MDYLRWYAVGTFFACGNYILFMWVISKSLGGGVVSDEMNNLEGSETYLYLNFSTTRLYKVLPCLQKKKKKKKESCLLRILQQNLLNFIFCFCTLHALKPKEGGYIPQRRDLQLNGLENSRLLEVVVHGKESCKTSPSWKTMKKRSIWNEAHDEKTVSGIINRLQIEPFLFFYLKKGEVWGGERLR